MDKLQEAQLNQQAITNEHLDALHTLSGELNDKIDKLNKGLTDHKIEVNVPEFKDFPEIKLPEIKIPEIKIPKIEVPKIPEPKVTVKPNITVEPTPVKFPKEMEVKGLNKIIEAIPDPYSIRDEVSRTEPLPIMVMDAQGRQITDFGGSFSAPNIVGIKIGNEVLSGDTPIPTTSAMNIPAYDEQVIGYTAGELTSVTYKKGGVTVATLTLTYTAGDLTGVVRT